MRASFASLLARSRSLAWRAPASPAGFEPAGLFLPRTDDALPATEEQQREARRDGGGRVVWVVEDYPQLRLLVSTVLMGAGDAVVAAEAGHA